LIATKEQLHCNRIATWEQPGSSRGAVGEQPGAAATGAMADTSALRGAPVDDLPSWFHGRLSRVDAVRVLAEAGTEEGSFLVRNSSKDAGFVLSACAAGRVAHYQIRQETTPEAGS